MKYIQLTQNYWAVVSNKWYPKLVAMGKWQASVCDGTVYARRTIHVNGKKTTVYMHRVIAGVDDPEKQVDHLNGDGLCNLDCNLEVVTLDENIKREHIRLGNRC